MNDLPQRAYIALGSNLSSPVQQVSSAICEIAELTDIFLRQQSSLYSSQAIGPGKQNNYINAVIAVDTVLSPIALLDKLQAIENNHGRERKIRWEPRTLDLDILLYSNLEITQERLTLPHPEMLHRSFVLFPLMEIAPTLILPSGISLEQACQQCPPLALEKLSKKEEKYAKG